MELQAFLSRLAVVVTATMSSADAQWTAISNSPGDFLDNSVLLTDGTVMCHVYNSNRWRRLTPDVNGSYANGTWSDTAPMPNGTDPSFGCFGCEYRPLYFATAVLASGKVVVIGGEYNDFDPVWTNIGFMYDPVTNTWSSQLVEPFGGGNIGDASCIVLTNGILLLADGTGSSGVGNLSAFNPVTLTFTALNPTGKADSNNEENWNILPNGKVLTVDARVVAQSELYDSVTNTWGNRVSTVVNLADFGTVTNSKEIGPGVLRPDGKLIYFSGTASGQNALYDFTTNSWSHTVAMDFPLVPSQTYHYAVADGPASLLPNGNVLVMASPVTNVLCGTPPCYVFNQPSHFFEFDLPTNTLMPVADSPSAASFIAYQGRMVLLPSGEVLLTAYDQDEIQDVMLYSNGGAPEDAWRPVITAAPANVVAGNTYSISGRLFNGFSEGASYGDDAQSSTNYPLVRIENDATGHVLYCRTHGHSRMGVETIASLEIITTQFDVPAGLEPGQSQLVVVANGIPSLPVVINVPNECWLVVGQGAGSATATVDGVTFQTQLQSVASTYEVTTTDFPAFALPARSRANHGTWKIDRPMILATQVVMYNPAAFPSNPNQWSQRMVVYAAPNEQPIVSWHGHQNGIHITYETFFGPDGHWYVQFPFTIDGL